MLDKAVSVLAAVESGPATLAQLVAATGLARPTTHRIAVALEHHRLLARDVQGRFVLGPRVAELASAAGEDRLLAVSQPVLVQLRDLTGESAQLYRLAGSRGATDVRVCVAAAERASGLRDTVPVGAALPMTAGSAAQVLLAWEEGERMHRGLRGAKFTATALAAVRRRGWAASAAERELGVASVSAPVRGAGGKVLAAVSVSGPIERLTRSPGRLHAPAVVSAGERIGELLRADSSARPLAKLYATVYGRRQRLVCAFSHDRSARKRKRAAKRGPAARDSERPTRPTSLRGQTRALAWSAAESRWPTMPSGLPASAPRHHPRAPAAAPRHHPRAPAAAPRHHPRAPAAAPRHHPRAPAAARMRF